MASTGFRMNTEDIMKQMREKYGLKNISGWKNGLTPEKLLKIVSRDDRAILNQAFAKDKRYQHINQE
jgi:hypothetical protein